MIIKVVNKSGRELPQYATESSAGVDLRAAIEEPIVLEPLQRAMVPTGLYMEIPKGYEGQVRPRSGLAAKHGVTVLNTPGTIDSGYRGEVGVILANFGQEPFVVEKGMKIAQIVVAPVEQAEIEEVLETDATERGAGGFGSTGV